MYIISQIIVVSTWLDCIRRKSPDREYTIPAAERDRNDLAQPITRRREKSGSPRGQELKAPHPIPLSDLFSSCRRARRAASYICGLWLSRREERAKLAAKWNFTAQPNICGLQGSRVRINFMHSRILVLFKFAGARCDVLLCVARLSVFGRGKFYFSRDVLETAGNIVRCFVLLCGFSVIYRSPELLVSGRYWYA